jgi:predicted dehydrogenase
MVEKPLAMTGADAHAMVEAVAGAGVKAMVGFENRWNPRFIAARELITTGQLGDIVGQIMHLNDTRFVPTEMLSWSARSSPVWFLMPHTLDLVRWLSGKTARSVYAQGVKKVLTAEGIDTWDSVDVALTFTDGTTATLHSSWVLPVSNPAVYDLRCEFVGTRSALRIEGADQGLTLLADKLTWPQWGVQERGGRIAGFPVDMAHDFADYVLGRIDDVPTMADGLIVTTTLAAVDESLRTGQPVTLDAQEV